MQFEIEGAYDRHLLFLYQKCIKKGFNNILGMTQDGILTLIKASNSSEVFDMNIRETLTFSPWLIRDGEIVSGLDNGANHPRTFIGQVYREDGMLEYYIAVAEGRSSTDAGLSNIEMANILYGLGVDIGYNLDGGGSSVMTNF